MPEIKNLGQLYQQTAKRFPKKAAFLFKRRGFYEPLLWEEASRQIDSVSSAYMAMGIKPNDRIAILSENSPEWAMADLAAQSIGIITVPLYPSLTPAEVRYILDDSGASLVVVSDKSQLQKIVSIQESLPRLKTILALDPSLAALEDDLSAKLLLWKDVILEPAKDELDSLKGSVEGGSIASIIYTSGTTGSPKGVMLTHSNFIHNVTGCRDTLGMNDSEVHLSFLPLCHVFERTAGYYLMIYLGATIAYAENMDTVAKNMREVRPTFLLGVPRFFEKVQARVLDAVKKADPFRKAFYYWARDIGDGRREGKRGTGFFTYLEDRLIEILVWRTFRRGLGGRVRFCVSGGAAISREVSEFFCDLGVMIYEGYGLTETSPVISVNRQNKWRFGTVGVPLAGVEIMIAEDQEILTRSASVMKGYYNKPEDTSLTIKEDWFCTGDLGKIDVDGFLSITGRKKELIVNSGGKKVSPRPIEELLTKDSLILRCVLFGEGKKFLTALIVPRRDELLAYADEQKIAYPTYDELLKDQKLISYIDSRIQAMMSDFSSYEKIKYFVLIDRDFSQEAGELTPTLKIKRQVIYTRYKHLLESFYSEKYGRG